MSLMTDIRPGQQAPPDRQDGSPPGPARSIIKHSPRKRLIAFVAAVIAAAALIIGLSVAPAGATPNFCYGDVCINEAGQSLTTLYLHVWAFNVKFYGHFELQTPTGAVHNSKQEWYYAGGSGPTWGLPIVYGWYCATAWKYLGPGNYFNLGTECIIAGS
jgi:hypothetical protein